MSFGTGVAMSDPTLDESVRSLASTDPAQRLRAASQLANLLAASPTRKDDFYIGYLSICINSLLRAQDETDVEGRLLAEDILNRLVRELESQRSDRLLIEFFKATMHLTGRGRCAALRHFSETCCKLKPVTSLKFVSRTLAPALASLAHFQDDEMPECFSLALEKIFSSLAPFFDFQKLIQIVEALLPQLESNREATRRSVSVAIGRVCELNYSRLAQGVNTDTEETDKGQTDEKILWEKTLQSLLSMALPSLPPDPVPSEPLNILMQKKERREGREYSAGVLGSVQCLINLTSILKTEATPSNSVPPSCLSPHQNSILNLSVSIIWSGDDVARTAGLELLRILLSGKKSLNFSMENLERCLSSLIFLSFGPDAQRLKTHLRISCLRCLSLIISENISILFDNFDDLGPLWPRALNFLTENDPTLAAEASIFLAAVVSGLVEKSPIQNAALCLQISQLLLSHLKKEKLAPQRQTLDAVSSIISKLVGVVEIKNIFELVAAILPEPYSSSTPYWAVTAARIQTLSTLPIFLFFYFGGEYVAVTNLQTEIFEFILSGIFDEDARVRAVACVALGDLLPKIITPSVSAALNKEAVGICQLIFDGPKTDSPFFADAIYYLQIQTMSKYLSFPTRHSLAGLVGLLHHLANILFPDFKYSNSDFKNSNSNLSPAVNVFLGWVCESLPIIFDTIFVTNIFVDVELHASALRLLAVSRTNFHDSLSPLFWSRAAAHVLCLLTISADDASPATIKSTLLTLVTAEDAAKFEEIFQIFLRVKDADSSKKVGVVNDPVTAIRNGAMSALTTILRSRISDHPIFTSPKIKMTIRILKKHAAVDPANVSLCVAECVDAAFCAGGRGGVDQNGIYEILKEIYPLVMGLLRTYRDTQIPAVHENVLFLIIKLTSVGCDLVNVDPSFTFFSFLLSQCSKVQYLPSPKHVLPGLFEFLGILILGGRLPTAVPSVLMNAVSVSLGTHTPILSLRLPFLRPLLSRVFQANNSEAHVNSLQESLTHLLLTHISHPPALSLCLSLLSDARQRFSVGNFEALCLKIAEALTPLLSQFKFSPAAHAPLLNLINLISSYALPPRRLWSLLRLTKSASFERDKEREGAAVTTAISISALSLFDETRQISEAKITGAAADTPVDYYELVDLILSPLLPPTQNSNFNFISISIFNFFFALASRHRNPEKLKNLNFLDVLVAATQPHPLPPNSHNFSSEKKSSDFSSGKFSLAAPAAEWCQLNFPKIFEKILEKTLHVNGNFSEFENFLKIFCVVGFDPLATLDSYINSIGENSLIFRRKKLVTSLAYFTSVAVRINRFYLFGDTPLPSDPKIRNNFIEFIIENSSVEIVQKFWTLIGADETSSAALAELRLFSPKNIIQAARLTKCLSFFGGSASVVDCLSRISLSKSSLFPLLRPSSEILIKKFTHESDENSRRSGLLHAAAATLRNGEILDASVFLSNPPPLSALCLRSLFFSPTEVSADEKELSRRERAEALAIFRSVGFREGGWNRKFRKEKFMQKILSKLKFEDFENVCRCVDGERAFLTAVFSPLAEVTPEVRQWALEHLERKLADFTRSPPDSDEISTEKIDGEFLSEIFVWANGETGVNFSTKILIEFGEKYLEALSSPPTTSLRITKILKISNFWLSLFSRANFLANTNLGGVRNILKNFQSIIFPTFPLAFKNGNSEKFGAKIQDRISTLRILNVSNFYPLNILAVVKKVFENLESAIWTFESEETETETETETGEVGETEAERDEREDFRDAYDEYNDTYTSPEEIENILRRIHRAGWHSQRQFEKYWEILFANLHPNLLGTGRVSPAGENSTDENNFEFSWDMQTQKEQGKILRGLSRLLTFHAGERGKPIKIYPATGLASAAEVHPRTVTSPSGNLFVNIRNSIEKIYGAATEDAIGANLKAVERIGHTNRRCTDDERISGLSGTEGESVRVHISNLKDGVKYSWESVELFQYSNLLLPILERALGIDGGRATRLKLDSMRCLLLLSDQLPTPSDSSWLLELTSNLYTSGLSEDIFLRWVTMVGMCKSAAVVGYNESSRRHYTLQRAVKEALTSPSPSMRHAGGVAVKFLLEGDSVKLFSSLHATISAEISKEFESYEINSERKNKLKFSAAGSDDLSLSKSSTTWERRALWATAEICVSSLPPIADQIITAGMRAALRIVSSPDSPPSLVKCVFNVIERLCVTASLRETHTSSFVAIENFHSPSPLRRLSSLGLAVSRHFVSPHSLPPHRPPSPPEQSIADLILKFRCSVPLEGLALSLSLPPLLLATISDEEKLAEIIGDILEEGPRCPQLYLPPLLLPLLSSPLSETVERSVLNIATHMLISNCENVDILNSRLLTSILLALSPIFAIKNLVPVLSGDDSPAGSNLDRVDLRLFFIAAAGLLAHPNLPVRSRDQLTHAFSTSRHPLLLALHSLSRPVLQ